MTPANVPCIKVDVRPLSPHRAEFSMDASDCPADHKPFEAYVQYGADRTEVVFVSCRENEVISLIVDFRERTLRTVRVFSVKQMEAGVGETLERRR